MRRSLLSIAVSVAVAACSGSTAVPTEMVPAPTAEVTSTTTTTSAAPPPSSSSSTTTTSSSTTTTIPLLDRSSAATTSRLQADLEALLSNGPRPAGGEAEARALAWFAETAASITGVLPAVRSVPLPNGTDSANVWVGPLGDGGTVLLIGSHIDSIGGSPGADDNGSGIVIQLELMRRLSEDPPEGVGVVFVAFGAEEFVPGFDHHYGSDLAAREMGDAGTLPDRMISVDMVGVGDALYSVPYRGADTSFAEELVDVAAAIGVELVLRPRGDISDHVPFARAGVPSVLLLRGDNPAYHTPGDDEVEIDGVLESLAVVEALIEALQS